MTMPGGIEIRTAIETEPEAALGLSPDVLRVLIENHARFLAFLQRRVGDRDVAQEILQQAFVKGIDRGGALKKDESAVAWFYRLLRNALGDHFRRRGAERRALSAVAAEPETPGVAPDDELMHTVCGCVRDLIATLKPEYARAVERVDLDGLTVPGYAAESGITANNAGVRLHRAREALRRQVEQSCGACATHGCLDCSCPAGRVTAC
jgi:RNA polymerase sigma factor (sigma-70 family)